MVEYLAICFLVLVCAVTSSVWPRRDLRILSMSASFILLFAFLSLRYSYGNDYWAYEAIFDNVDLYALSSEIEGGWIWLNIALQPLGFRAVIMITALVYLWVVFWFILNETPRTYIWISFFLLLVEPSNFLIHLSAMRQALAIIIFMVALHALAARRIFLYVILVVAASVFHRSVLSMLPLILIALPEMSTRISQFMSGRRWIALYVVIYFAVALLFTTYGPGWLESVKAEVFRYSSYDEKGSVRFGLGVLVQMLFFGIFVFYGLKHRGRERIFLYVSAATYLILPLVLVNAWAARLMMYPQVAMFVALPIALKNERRRIFRILLLTLFCSWTIISNIGFWQSEIYSPYYEDYESVFSIPLGSQP